MKVNLQVLGKMYCLIIMFNEHRVKENLKSDKINCNQVIAEKIVPAVKFVIEAHEEVSMYLICFLYQKNLILSLIVTITTIQ